MIGPTSVEQHFCSSDRIVLPPCAMEDICKGEYSDAWRRYRRWSRVRWMALLAYLPIQALCAKLDMGAGIAMGVGRRGGCFFMGAHITTGRP
jgi:hypothetical protein